MICVNAGPELSERDGVTNSPFRHPIRFRLLTKEAYMSNVSAAVIAAASLLALGACTVNTPAPAPAPAPSTTVITPPPPAMMTPGSTVVVPRSY